MSFYKQQNPLWSSQSGKLEAPRWLTECEILDAVFSDWSEHVISDIRLV